MKILTENVDWDYYDRFKTIVDKYMPGRGEGETIASQMVTAINKLIYKWYNDGDVFDNTYGLEGWANDLSSYANWLYYHIDATKDILSWIKEIATESEYEDLLKELADKCLNDSFIEENGYDKQPKEGSIYNEDGPFEYRYYDEDEEDDDWDDDDDYYEGYKRNLKEAKFSQDYANMSLSKLSSLYDKYLQKSESMFDKGNDEGGYYWKDLADEVGRAIDFKQANDDDIE